VVAPPADLHLHTAASAVVQPVAGRAHRPMPPGTGQQPRDTGIKPLDRLAEAPSTEGPGTDRKIDPRAFGSFTKSPSRSIADASKAARRRASIRSSREVEIVCRRWRQTAARRAVFDYSKPIDQQNPLNSQNRARSRNHACSGSHQQSPSSLREIRNGNSIC
jgi:hypothetical protein